MKHYGWFTAAAFGSALLIAQAPHRPMTVTQDGDALVIRVPLHPPKLSGTGKTRTVASDRTVIELDGEQVTVQVNAYIPQAK